MKEYKAVKIVPEIKGCYGQRIYIPVEIDTLVNLFDTISLWRQNVVMNEEGKTEIVFELPCGQDIRENRLLVRALNMWGLTVSGVRNYI